MSINHLIIATICLFSIVIDIAQICKSIFSYNINTFMKGRQGFETRNKSALNVQK